MEFFPVTPSFGDRVEGIDLGGDLHREDRAKLCRMFDDRGLLLMRDVDIDLTGQDLFCRMLVDDDDGPGMADGRPPMLVSNVEPGGNAPFGRLLFHSDMMWSANPFKVLSLYALVAEPGSATTNFASGAHAWTVLPAKLRRRIADLHVIHATGQVYRRGGDDLLVPERRTEQSTVTPIVRHHPRTGRPILYVSEQMTTEVVELPGDEGEDLLQELFGYLYDPSVVYAHTWQAGDLAVFDNLALQHSRGNVLADGPARTLRKVIAPVPQIAAERPTFAGARSPISPIDAT